jgi:DNA-binding CsgD family transcriptional regulator
MLLERVLMLWDQVPQAAELIGADYVRVLEEAAEVARSAGEQQRGLAFIESALAELDEGADPVRVALLLAQRYAVRGELGLPEQLEDLERALMLVPPAGSNQARMTVLITATHFGCHTGASHFREWAQEGLRLAREAGDREAEAQALTAMAMLGSAPLGLAEPGSETFRLLGQAREIAEQVGAYQPVIKIVVYESHLLCGAGEYDRAAEVARQGIAHAERQGLARTRGAFLAINVAEPLEYLGRWDEAVGVAERALDLAPPWLTRVGLWLVSGSIALARGDLADAARRAAASRAVQADVRYDDQHALPQANLDIQLSLLTEGPAAALALAAAAVARYDLSASSPRYVWPLLATAARAAVAARDAAPDTADAADALLGRLRTLVEKTEVVGPVQRAWQLSYAAVDPAPDADAVAAADAATEAWEAIKQPYPAALALLRAAEAALSRPGPDGRAAAAIRLRRAAPIAERLGARPLAGRIADLARRAGETASGDAGQLGLTGREFEVLRLVAAGQSNREIATALFISPKTASVHVSNILAKLGAATRTEAAAKAYALGVFDADG